jgi:hypothetical protein
MMTQGAVVASSSDAADAAVGIDETAGPKLSNTRGEGKGE